MYLYHAHAVALNGKIDSPTPQTIPTRGSCALGHSGGTSSAKEGKFDNGLVSFDSASSDLMGHTESKNGKTIYWTSVSAAICGLNIRNMVKADHIAVRVVCEHEQPADPSANWGEPHITTGGCHFENLRIAGHAVTIDMDHQVFKDCPTYGDFQSAWKGNDKPKIEAILLGKTMPVAPANTDPQHLQETWSRFQGQMGLSTLNPVVLCSFVKAVNGINGGEIDNWGPIIRIPQFGTLYLGEVFVRPSHRLVSMLRVQLGSPESGVIQGPIGGGNGNVG